MAYPIETVEVVSGAEAWMVLKLLSMFFKMRSRWVILGVLLCLLTPLAARAENRDIVQFGNSITVQEGEEAHDVVCFLCSVEIDGTVHGDVVAFLGSIRVRGHAEHDAVAFLGNISVGEGASIDHDAVVFAGNLRTGSGGTIGRDRVVFPIFLFALPFIVLAAIIALIVWAVRALVYRGRPVYPMPPPRM